jgi:carbamoyltransferase
MRVLGITGGMHSCGLALIDDGKPIFAFEEERYCRIKPYKDAETNFFRYPVQSLGWVKEKYSEYLKDIDYITGFLPKEVFANPMIESLGLRNFTNAPYIEVSHHEAHCNLAYYLSNFQEDTLVISIDASGNNHSAKFYIGKNGDLKYIDGLDLSRKSLGHYYSMLTEFLGFKRLKDEGKVVGMASHGSYDEELYQIFNQCIKIDGYKTDLDNSSEVVSGGIYKDFYNLFFSKVGSKPFYIEKSLIAYNGQLVFEEKILQIINHLHTLYPTAKNIALAGGVFANIKLNKRINELDWVKEVFIAPPMGDEGTPLGCALTTYKKFTPDFKPFKLNDIFLGIEFTDQETEEIYWDKNKFTRRPYNPEHIAWDLKEGKIVGWFQGRYEHGPRALCNRSIIADPSVPGTYKKINDRLQRNDFMPFAPVVIDKYANQVFNVTKSSYTAEFMTMLYDTREEWINKIPAVVHPIDKTARIQIVTETNNPKFYQLINKFNDITNIPVLLNTSFNVHEEPIVCTPGEAFVHLENNIVDVLVIGNYIFTKNDK